MYTLIIVDMQEGFDSAKCNVTAHNVINLVKKAKEDQANIITLEYHHFGHTRSDIKIEIGPYSKHKTAIKYNDDGSKEALKAGASMFDKVVICGVNISFCVYSTAEGLTLKGKTVEVVREACNDQYRTSKQTIGAFKLMGSFKNCMVV